MLTLDFMTQFGVINPTCTLFEKFYLFVINDVFVQSKHLYTKHCLSILNVRLCITSCVLGLLNSVLVAGRLFNRPFKIITYGRMRFYTFLILILDLYIDPCSPHLL